MAGVLGRLVQLGAAAQHGERFEHEGKEFEAGVDAGEVVVVRLDHVVGHWRDCKVRGGRGEVKLLSYRTFSIVFFLFSIFTA